MTDGKNIWLISWRVSVFPAAAARQFFNGECDAADLKYFPGVILPVLLSFGLLVKGTASPLTKSCICHCTDCLRCLWSNLVTLPSRSCMHHLLYQQSETNLVFPDRTSLEYPIEFHWQTLLFIYPTGNGLWRIGHVTDDVTLSWKVKVITPVRLGPNRPISKQLEMLSSNNC